MKFAPASKPFIIGAQIMFLVLFLIDIAAGANIVRAALFWAAAEIVTVTVVLAALLMLKYLLPRD